MKHFITLHKLHDIDDFNLCYFISNTSLGIVAIVAGNYVYSLGWYDEEQHAIDFVNNNFPHANRLNDANELIIEIIQFMEGGVLTTPITVGVMATDFQFKVWQALLEIPFGKTKTYKDLALQLQDANASRAVGTAVGANPVAYLIPCHRVLAGDGSLTGFRWGINRKRQLLQRESGQFTLF